jgi:Fe-S cluster biosynthesis and repair protein YggX
MSRIIFCYRLKKEMEGLEAPPFPGRVGEEIFSKTSKYAWGEWREMQIKIINEYRLDLSEAEARKTLMQQMRNFLSLDEKNGEAKDVLHVGTPTHQK